MSPGTEVIEHDATAPIVPDKGAGKDEVTISRTELESLHRQLDESQKSERDWAAFHRGAGAPRSEPAAEPEETLNAEEFIDPEAGAAEVTDDTPEKLVDDLAAQGVGALAKRGFVTAADAQRLAVEVATRVSREMIGRERQKMTTDSQIMNEFPELRDQNSALFKATAIRYQRAVAMDPNAKKTPAALFLAADAARESLKARAPVRRDGEDPDPGREDEADRRARAASQDSRTRGRASAEETDDLLGSEAKAVIKAMGITDAEYKASRAELAGARGRRR